MKVSLRWLEEFIELPTRDPAELSDTFTMLGHEVEGVDLLDIGWTDVYVGRVTEISAHPDADKIRVCQVDTGGGPEQIICGAWNFGTGATVAVARPGALLPGDFQIGQREIRGVLSNGMICSEKELGLGDDHEGILVLDDDLEVGIPFGEVVELPDVVFDLDITANRSDAMSMLGIARDLAAFYAKDYRIPAVYWKPVAGETDIRVSIEDPEGCRRFTAREITGVAVGPSPFRVRHRLRKAGVRPISNVVDATNYVMLELGQPLHAFDADTIVDGKLTVKRASAGETLVTLDDEDRELSTDDLIIYDGEGPTSMSGTMGGARSEVGESTTRVLMEAASWDPPTIMYMARRHTLRSEASTRFERGVDPNLTGSASQRASALVAKWAGGRVLEEGIDEIGKQTPAAVVELNLAHVDQLLGPGFTTIEVAGILKRLGMKVEGEEPMKVTAPTYRPDVTRPADLVEEVARIHGYDRFEATVPTGAAGRLTPEQKRRRKLFHILVGAGLTQAINLPFVSEEDLRELGVVVTPDQLLTVKNPLREDESKLRPTMLPGLLRAVRRNTSYGTADVGFFEAGSVFSTQKSSDDPRLPDERERLAWVIVGDVGLESLGSESLDADASVSIGLWQLLTSALGIEAALIADDAPGFHPTRTARVEIDGRPVGYVGELSPLAARSYGFKGRAAVAELELAPLLEPVEPPRGASPSVYPHVDFDLSFLVEGNTAGDLVAVTSEAAGELLEWARVFDDFSGDGRRSLAIRYRLRASDRTLEAEEIGQVRSAMIDAATAAGAELRGA